MFLNTANVYSFHPNYFYILIHFSYFQYLIYYTDILYIVKSCNNYALFVIIAQILQNLAFPLFTAIIKTHNQCKLRSTLENAKSNP